MRKIVVALLASVGAFALMTAMPAASGARIVEIEDRCEAASFNAAIGDGTCLGDGDVTFAEFLAVLNPIDFGHEHWRFQFGRGRIDRGERLKAANDGGEFHTFTEVAEYGGGCIDELNQPLALTPVAECAAVTEVAPGVFVPTAFITTGIDPGGTLDVPRLTAGEHKFQCLIHPWMRIDVEVRK